jgi:hypothetical protein
MFVGVVSGLHSSYLGMCEACRNGADMTFPAKAGTPGMTTFDKREEAFEKKFVIDEELKFKAGARRNRLLGLWVAEKLGMSADEAQAYAKEVIAAEFGGGGDADVIRKVIADLAAGGISVDDAEVRAKMDEWMALAIAQVKAGT